MTKRVLFFAVLLSLAAAVPACGQEKGLKIKSLDPNTGPADGAGRVTINGNGFTQGGALGVKVYFGDKKATFLRFEGDTKMLVSPPPGTLGQKVDVLIIFSDGRQHKFPGAYTYADAKAGFDINALTPDKPKSAE